MKQTDYVNALERARSEIERLPVGTRERIRALFDDAIRRQSKRVGSESLVDRDAEELEARTHYVH